MAGGFRFGFIDATILRGGLGDFYSGYQNLDRGTPDHLHHLFPEARRGWFERRGFTGVFDIDNSCVRISRPVHEAIHMNVYRQKRWMTLPEGWNHRIMWRLVQLEANLGAKLNVEDDFPAIWTIVRDLVHEFGLPRTLEIYPVHRRR